MKINKTETFKYHYVSLNIMELRTRARKWGNSIAVILPKIIVEAGKIRENDVIAVEIRKKPLAGEFFGKFPVKSKKTTQKIKDEMRKGWN